MKKNHKLILMAAVAVAAALVFFPQIYVWISTKLGKAAEIQKVGG